MAFNVTTAKTRLGIDPSDTSQDATIQTELDMALGFAEKYCSRLFRRSPQVESHYFSTHSSVQLSRFPVEVIVSLLMTGDGRAVPTNHTKLNHVTGVLEFDRVMVEREIQIAYIGGYLELPPDLELALWLIFDNVHAYNSAAAGGALAAGDVQSVTLQGVGTVRFVTSGSSSSSSSSSGPYGGFIPLSATGILDLYVLHGA